MSEADVEEGHADARQWLARIPRRSIKSGDQSRNTDTFCLLGLCPAPNPALAVGQPGALGASVSKVALAA